MVSRKTFKATKKENFKFATKNCLRKADEQANKQTHALYEV